MQEVLCDKLSKVLLHKYIQVSGGGQCDCDSALTASSWPLFSSSTAPLSHFQTFDTGSYFGTPLETLSAQSSFPPSFFYRVSPSPAIFTAQRVCVCACVCVFFHYHGSEIAPSVPGARQAPDSAFIRISTLLPRDDPTCRGGQDEISICSEVEIRGSDRD